MNNRVKALVIGLLVLTASGCAGVRARKDYLVEDLLTPDRAGVYHKVKKGETLWRIAKTYDVVIDDIIRTNRIPNVARVEENQLVFIPGVDLNKDVAAAGKDDQNNFIWPVQGKVVKYFHQRDGAYLNKGIDIQVYEDGAVKAARPGRVVFADYLTGYGYTVILEHTEEFLSVYARNAKLLVKLNDTVRQGQEIARIARVNNLARLHFEIRKNSTENNPLYYLP